MVAGLNRPGRGVPAAPCPGSSFGSCRRSGAKLTNNGVRFGEGFLSTFINSLSQNEIMAEHKRPVCVF